MASKNLLVLDEKAVASNRVKPSYMQKQGGASNGSADKTKSYDSPLILKANNSSSYKTLQTPELDKATGNDTPWYERVRNTLETGTAKAADALQIGMLKGEAGLFEAAGKVAEKVGAAGGRDAVNKSPFDWLYDKADEARAEEAAVRERAYAGTGKAGQFALQAIEGGSKLATDVAVSAMAGLPTMAVTGAGAFGSSAYEAEQEGATLNEALAYGAASAGLEAGIEKLTGGLDKIYGKSLTDDLVKGLVKRAGGNETAQWALQRLANAAGEGGEEALTSALSPFLKAIYDEGKAAKESYGTAEGRKGLGNEALYSAMLGAVIGAAGDLATGGLGEYPGGKSPLILRDIKPEAQPQTKADRQTATAERPAQTGETNPLVAALDAKDSKQRPALQQSPLLVSEEFTQTTPLIGEEYTAYSHPMIEQNTDALQQGEAPANIPSTNKEIFAVAQAEGTEPTPGPVDFTEAETRDNITRSTTGEPGGAARQSQTVQTVRDAGITPEYMKTLIDLRGSKGGFDYFEITNDQSVQRAEESIRRVGWQTAYANWKRDVYAGKAGDQMTAIGALLYNNAVSAGDQVAAMDILGAYKAVMGNTARGLQAGRIINKMAPANRLYMIEKQLADYTETLNLPDGITISKNLKNAYLNAPNEEARNKVITDMQKEVARQLPTTWLEWWNALRYTNMLGNFKTQERNLLGNTSNLLMKTAKDNLKTVIERVALPQDARTSSVIVGKKYMDAARSDFATVKDAAMGAGKYSANEAQGFMQGAQERKRVFNSFRTDTANPVRNVAAMGANVLLTPAELYRRGTNWAMEIGDAVFSKAAYSRSLGGWMKARGISAERFSSMLAAEKAGNITKADADILNEGRLYAIKEAKEVTLRDDNKFADRLAKLGRGNASVAEKILVGGNLPFLRTPANALVRAVEYSPLGFVDTAYKAVQMRKPTSEITGNDIINGLSKNLTGTGMFVLGLALANAGYLIGQEPDDKQAAFNALQGEQENALVLPDGRSVTIDAVSGAAVPLLMGANLAGLINDEGLNWETLDDALTSIFDPLIQSSMLQGMDDTLNNIKYSDNNLLQLFLQSAVAYITQGITNTALGQAERSTEANRMETFVDQESPVPDWLQREIGKASAKTPGWDHNQIDYIDAWGRTQDYGDAKTNAVNQFFNPSYVSTDRSTPIDGELQRLYDAGYTGVFPQRFAQSDEITTRDAEGNSTGKRHLTAEEYEQFNRTMGATRLELAEALIGSAQYKNMSNDEKAKAIENIYAVGKAKAMLEVDPNYKPDGWVREALEAKDPAKYIGLYSAAQKLQPWGDNESVAVWQRVKYVAKAAGKDADEYVPLFFDAGSNYPQKYRMARERGYSAERFAEFYEAYATIESDRDANGKSLGNVRQKVVAALVSQGWPEQYANEMYNLFKADKTKLNDWRW